MIPIWLLAFLLLAALALAALIFAPKGWRTVWTNAAVLAPLIVGQVLDYLIGVNWSQVLPPHAAAWLVIGVNVLNIGLRSATTTPLGRKN